MRARHALRQRQCVCRILLVLGVLLIMPDATVIGRGVDRPPVGLTYLRGGGPGKTPSSERFVRIEAWHTGLKEKERLAVVGNIRELGGWKTEGAHELQHADQGVWTSVLQVPEGTEVQ